MRNIGDIVDPYGEIAAIVFKQCERYYLLNKEEDGIVTTSLMPASIIDYDIEQAIKCIDAIIGE